MPEGNSDLSVAIRNVKKSKTVDKYKGFFFFLNCLYVHIGTHSNAHKKVIGC